MRSACRGSRAADLNAGGMLARTPVSSRTATAAAYANRSVLALSSSKLAYSRDVNNAAIKPAVSPHASGSIALRRVSANTSRELAPNATRSPASRARSVAVKETTL
jgi:hypothetical protein